MTYDGGMAPDTNDDVVCDDVTCDRCAAARFRRKMREWRATGGIPGYIGPRAVQR